MLAHSMILVAATWQKHSDVRRVNKNVKKNYLLSLHNKYHHSTEY